MEKKVKVLYILTKLELGGAQKVCLSLLEGIQKKGEFSALISGAQGVLVSQAQKSDSVYLIESFKREVGIKTIFNELKTLFLLIKKIRNLKKQNPDLIVHTHSTKAGILGRWAAFFARVKTIVHTVHGFGFHEHQNKISWTIIFLFEYFASFITTHYVCVSQNDVNIGKKYLPKFGKKSSVIRAAVEWDKFYGATKTEGFGSKEFGAKELGSEKFIIGTVSCLKPQKNLIDLLKAFKHLHDDKKINSEIKQNLLLQIIGDGVQKPEIEKWINKNNLQDKIELLGWQNDVSSWMKKWNVFVMSSLWEGLPCAIIEARLSKLPVVSYNISGIPEVIIENKNGYLIPAGNWKMLAQRINQLVLNRNELESMSNYKDNLEDFKNEKMVEYHLQLYKQLI